MKNKLRLLLISMIFVFTLGINSKVKAEQISETEPNETVTTATLISVGDTYSGEIGSYYLYRQRGHERDIDYIKVNLEINKSYVIQMTNYFEFYRDTTLLCSLISPTGRSYSVGNGFVYNPEKNVDNYCFTANETGTYYIKLYNYFDLTTKSSHYYDISIYNKCDVMGHTWNEGEITTAPTCTETGVKTLTCETCGETRIEEIKATGHIVVLVPFKFPSCTETGHIEYYKCSLCGELFKDEKGTQPITLSETVIEKDEHSYVNRLEKADIYENGKIYTECEYCFKKKGAITYIYRPKTVVLEKQYYYSGKKIQPKIVIKDIKGKVISPNEYKVTYTNNINPGTGKVTIIFKGNHYEGKITRSFKIVLRNTSALSVKNTSGRKIAVSWKKTALVSGYQIKYSVGNKAKTLTVSNKYASKKISNLSKGKTYKVYIRTYKTVKGKKVYSAWSKSRSVKIVR